MIEERAIYRVRELDGRWSVSAAGYDLVTFETKAEAESHYNQLVAAERERRGVNRDGERK
jgi:hypothetical protein